MARDVTALANTSGVIALLDHRDRHHAAAISEAKSWKAGGSGAIGLMLGAIAVQLSRNL